MVDILEKVRSLINWVIIGRRKVSYHPQKNSFFDILSLIDQFYKSRSIYLKSPKPSQIYFLENQVSDLIKLSLKYLSCAIKSSKKVILKNSIFNKLAKADMVNKSVEELFRQVKDELAILFELLRVE